MGCQVQSGTDKVYGLPVPDYTWHPMNGGSKPGINLHITEDINPVKHTEPSQTHCHIGDPTLPFLEKGVGGGANPLLSVMIL